MLTVGSRSDKCRQPNEEMSDANKAGRGAEGARGAGPWPLGPSLTQPSSRSRRDAMPRLARPWSLCESAT